MITTNLAYKQWGTVFRDASCLSALIERLDHLRRIRVAKLREARPDRAGELAVLVVADALCGEL